MNEVNKNCITSNGSVYWEYVKEADGRIYMSKEILEVGEIDETTSLTSPSLTKNGKLCLPTTITYNTTTEIYTFTQTGGLHEYGQVAEVSIIYEDITGGKTIELQGTPVGEGVTGTLQYRRDNGDWTEYTSSFEIKEPCRISARYINVVKEGEKYADSVEDSVDVLKLPNPMVDVPAAGTVTISASIPSQMFVYYTTDGSTPRAIDDMKYEAPFKPESDVTIKCINIHKGYVNSDMVEQKYCSVANNITMALSEAETTHTKDVLTIDGYNHTVGNFVVTCTKGATAFSVDVEVAGTPTDYVNVPSLSTENTGPTISVADGKLIVRNIPDNAIKIRVYDTFNEETKMYEVDA